jgi:hypothetical protein
MESMAGLKAYGNLLHELNTELGARFHELPPDIRALLAQKGAITQRATDDMGLVIEECAHHIEKYRQLLGQCQTWLDAFFIPLQAQCADQTVTHRVDGDDLKTLIADLQNVLAEANA